MNWLWPSSFHLEQTKLGCKPRKIFDSGRAKVWVAWRLLPRSQAHPRSVNESAGAKSNFLAVYQFSISRE